MEKRQYKEYLQERNGWFYFLYTIPKARLVLNSKGNRKNQIRISLNTKCAKTAKAKGGILLAQHIAMFEANDNTPFNFDSTAKAAETLGFSPYFAPNMQSMSIEDRIAAYSPILSAVNTVGATPPIVQAGAFVGVLDIPELPMSKLYQKLREVAPDMVKNKNETDAANAWKKYETIINFFIEVMGDLDVFKLTSATITKYRTELFNRMERRDFKSERANRYLMTLRLIVRNVLKSYDIEEFQIKDAWAKIERFKGFRDEGKRLPFTEDEVKTLRERVKGSNTLPDQLKAMATISENTGCGVKELSFLCPEDIALDVQIPHIKFRPNKHRKSLKTDERERDIPLLGDALEAMKKFPNGFTEYCDPKGPGRANRVLWSFIKKSAPDKSFISYRHRMATLLRNSKCKDQLQNAVMGHATPGMTGHYGDGVWLEEIKSALEDAAIAATKREQINP